MYRIAVVLLALLAAVAIIAVVYDGYSRLT